MGDVAVWFGDPSVEFRARISLRLMVFLGNKKIVKDNLLPISPTATLVSEVGLLLQSMKMASLGRSYEEELSKI